MLLIDYSKLKLMKDNEIKALIGKTISEQINKFKNQMNKIFLDKEKSRDEKLEKLEELVKEYTKEKNDNTSRDAQINHQNNDTPLARNRVIIQAEINQHKLNFDSSYNHHSKEEWETKLVGLQEELKNSPV